MRMKYMLIMITLLLSTTVLSACASKTGSADDVEQNATETESGSDMEKVSDTNSAADWDSENATIITLEEDAVSLEGEGASAEGTTVNIAAAGTYVLSGTLNNGQIIVEVDGTQAVQLVLNGVDITSTDSAAIYVKNAGEVVITLAENTSNTLTDGNTYTFESTTDTEPSGCIFSADDLTFNGAGELVVNGNYNNGIDSNNDLKIAGGNITVSAVNNGIKGTDSVEITGGNIIVNSTDDGIKSDNDTEEGQGRFAMSGGTVTITASDDGINATTSVMVTDGQITVSAKDKEVNCDGTTEIAEGCLITK